MAVGAGLRACPIKILFLKVKMRIAVKTNRGLKKNWNSFKMKDAYIQKTQIINNNFYGFGPAIHFTFPK
jgi:hypothetical protein